MPPILEAENLSKSFGRLEAIKNVSFKINQGEIFGIAGPNGAGKSTLYNIITKIPYPPDSGKVIFDKRDLDKVPAHQICQLGLARTFQKPAYFENETVIRNVMVGGYFGGPTKLLGLISSKSETESKSVEALRLVGMENRRNIAAGRLENINEKKLLMIASALVTNPKLLLLDEPFGGLNPSGIQEALTIIRRMNEKGITIVIIEHNMRALMGISDGVMILDHGEKIAQGTPEDIVNDRNVIQAYLGPV